MNVSGEFQWYRVVRACQVMEETANDILKQIPQLVDLEEVSDKYPVLYEQSMNTVLIQEIIRSVSLKCSLFTAVYIVATA